MKQKLFRYKSSSTFFVKTEDIPASSFDSEEPVNIISPYSSLFCFSPSLILTFSLTVKSSDGFVKTFIYVMNILFPSSKSFLFFPDNPLKNAPISDNCLYSTPSGHNSCINSSNLLKRTHLFQN